MCHKAAGILANAMERSPIPSGYAAQKKVAVEAKIQVKKDGKAILPAAL